jgi:hypothetical protein
VVAVAVAILLLPLVILAVLAAVLGMVLVHLAHRDKAMRAAMEMDWLLVAVVVLVA